MERVNKISKVMVSSEPVQICLLAASNGSHYNAAVIGSNPNFRVNLLTRRPEIFADKQVTGIHEMTKEKITGRLHIVSSNPSEVCKGTKIFVVSAPVNAQAEILRSIKPYVEHGAIIGSVFGQGGFDLIASDVFGEDLKKKNLAIFSFFNIPSTCKVIIPGKEVVMIGPKKFLSVGVIPKIRSVEVQHHCNGMWGVPVYIVPNFLNMLLTPGNQIIHSGRLVGLFNNKKAQPLDVIPYFYTDLNQLSADNMEKLSDEIQLIKNAILKRYPTIDLENVLPLRERILKQYGDQVKNPTNLYTTFTTNTGYRVMTIPMNKIADGRFVLNTKARTFVEDIPYGLCVLLDLAEMAGIKIPFTVRCIEWHQEMMGKEFVKNGKLNRDLIHETGAPSRYGYDTLEKLVGHYSN